MCVYIVASVISPILRLNVNIEAYDGHMNLILSDVEETIMIVEVTEGAPEGHGTVNVSIR
jgi:small nuclear ribonucleoprotein (snRNP)-like protein